MFFDFFKSRRVVKSNLDVLVNNNSIGLEKCSDNSYYVNYNVMTGDICNLADTIFLPILSKVKVNYQNKGFYFEKINGKIAVERYYFKSRDFGKIPGDKIIKKSIDKYNKYLRKY